MNTARLLCLLLTAVPAVLSAQTGIPVSGMTACDAQLQSLLNTYGIPGAQFALARNGKLVYDRAFGHADLQGQMPTRPDHLFRVASVSKPITAVAIMELVENGELALSDAVFGSGGLLADHPYLQEVVYTDMRLEDITVEHLLRHTGGWDRSINCFPTPTAPYTWTTPGCDPISAPLYVAATLGESNPIAKEALVRFLMERGLDHTPGTVYAYSNIGYLVLGLVIEQVSGMSYEDYVKSAVFEPLGICDAHLGRNLPADQLEREVEYEGEGYTTLSCYGTGQVVPWEYGGWNLEAMDAHGGWVASARELVKLLVAVDGFTTKPDILSSASVATMTAPSSTNTNYAFGWSVNSANNWWHTGALDGTASMIVRSSNGYTWALLLNKRLTNAQANAFWGAVDALGWNCIAGTTSWPTHDLMAMPLNNATDLSATPAGGGTVQVQCTAGDGDGRLVVVRPAGSPLAFPVDGVDYQANATYGLGDDLGNGTYVVSSGTATSITVDGFTGTGSYVVSVFEYTKNAATGQNALYKRCGRSDVEVNASSGVGVADRDAARATRLQLRGTLLELGSTVGGNMAVELLDGAGRVVLARSITQGQAVTLGGLATGVYTARLLEAGHVVEALRVVIL
jgi:CubicO group peptidase (beta-lactamase class C family)